ncbi:MAG: virulence associated E protein [Phormidium phage MIS-PhV1A]|uniref:DNA helicase n=1 Tax=Phormidium phage MIS-PhV1A TaxID=1391455 RepID=UPI0003C98624|nr:MAG: DNA helicase [Phormidium phage MIS-PhV1A]AGZ61805.1 MAG: virulence associated E protein [Phormidium phage MIS-PhV1A]
MNNLRVDRTQASKHLEYLGYRPGDNIYLRFFYHSSDPRKNDDRGRKESLLSWEKIEKYQSDGRGVYVVVNGADGGHTDAEIKQCCAIFCEWDDISLAEQFEKWSYLGFVEPTFTVYSGDKSMQPYWVFDEPIAPKQWRYLQNLLIEVMKADKSNKNPSRVFRLAGGWHVKPDREPQKTEIVGESGIRYNFMDLQLRLVDLLVADTSRTQLQFPSSETTSETAPPVFPELLPRTPGTTPEVAESSFDYSEGTPTRYKDITVPVPIAISIPCALGKSKVFLNGVASERNTSMAALARDLIGVQTEFAQLGQNTNSDAYTLFIDACRQCSPGGGWDEHEWEQIWASAVRSNPISSLSHYFADGLESCIKGEYWRYLKSLNQVSDEPETPETPIKNRALVESDDKMIQDYNKLIKHFGNRIRLNLLSKRIEVNGKVISLDRVKLQLAIRHGILLRSCREDIQDILVELAEQNQYSPIEEYLRGLPTPADTSILDNLAEKYFGQKGKIYQTFVRKTLIGAVARALRPGCKLDTALILQGKQGFKKSSFFKSLAGDYFDDSLGAVSDKDERLKLHRAWFVEWSELESIFKRRDVSQTKAFLSSAVDAIRPPYCRDTQDFARSSIIVATTNKDEFLSDETGNRRFWIVPIKKRINIDLLKQERDAIWAAAVLAFDQKEEWWLEYDEEIAAEIMAEEFQTSDPWQDTIASYIENREFVRVGDLLLHLQVDLNRQERAHQMRVAGLLKFMGWCKNFRIIAGKRVRVWCPDSDPPLPEKSDIEVDPKVDTNVVQAETLIPSAIENQTQQVEPLSLLITQKNLFLEKEEGETTGLTAETEKKESFGQLFEKVDHAPESQTEQEIQPAQPEIFEDDHLPLESSDVTELKTFIQTAIETDDRELAKNIQGILKETCKGDAAARKQVWEALSEEEQVAFTELVRLEQSYAHRILSAIKCGSKAVACAIELDLKRDIDAGNVTEAAVAKIVGQSFQDFKKLVALIAPIDAEKIRDIANIFWTEYYPEQTQSLITQMFGSGSPGTKYSQEIILEWLETENELVRDRITYLLGLVNPQS